jgi:hypothetical protein
MRTRIFAVVLLLAGLLALPQPARALDIFEVFDKIGGLGALALWAGGRPPDVREPPVPDVAPEAAAVARPIATTYRIFNNTATMEPGEPTEGGRMTRTVWGMFKAPAAERIVVHTYGSEIDTVLAAYRGTAIKNLVRVAGNDDKAVTGLSGLNNRHSLIQFNTTKNSEYSIQIGGRNQAQGDISLSMFRFPATGGLSAFLFQFTGFAFNGRDYLCEVSSNVGSSIFCDAKFIVHNSTSRTLTVTTSTTLGAGVTVPAPFNLAPGAARAVTISIKPAFERTVRTVSGAFIFTGRAGATTISEARYPALVLVKPGDAVQDLVQTEVTPTVQTGYLNEPLSFTAKITNTGSVTAIGCHMRSTAYSFLKTAKFYRINPANGARLGDDNEPNDIPAGQTHSYKVTVASQGSRDADHIDPEVIGDCANNSRRRLGLRGADISASGFFKALPLVELQSSTPAATSFLNVPRSGFAYFKVRTINRYTTKSLQALPAYVGPFDDPPNTRFTTEICRTNPSNGTCMGAYSTDVIYTATKNAVATFSVRVKAPTGAVPLNPERRRVFVNFKLADVPYFKVGAPSIAVRKQ